MVIIFAVLSHPFLKTNLFLFVFEYCRVRQENRLRYHHWIAILYKTGEATQKSVNCLHHHHRRRQDSFSLASKIRRSALIIPIIIPMTAILSRMGTPVVL